MTHPSIRTTRLLSGTSHPERRQEIWKLDVKSRDKHETGTVLLALGVELWRATQRFRRELEDYVGDDELEKRLKNIKL